MENNKNSFEIIKQNRYEVMLNDFRESDIDFISESDYMYALEKAEVFTEAYFGKTKNVLAIEKAMRELYEAMNAEPYKTHAGTPLARNLEKAIKDAFGFKKVVLNITTTMYDLPLVFTMVDIERFSQASDIIISRKHGYYDSMGRHSVIIQISSTFASQYGLTAEEYTAMLLHEIGHSMDHTPYIALRTLLTIIANPFAILLSNRVTGGIFAAVVQWVSNIITSTPVLSKINEWLTKAENIIARTAIPVLSVAALTAVPAAWAIGVIKLLRSAPGRKAEEFADSFAVSYGYGKELASALSKVDNRYTPNPRYNNALLNFMNDAGTAAGQILMIMSGDEHGTTTSRIRSMIDKAKRDLNRGNFNPEVKDMLIKDIEHLEREYDIIRGIYSVEGSNTPITDILRGFLDKVFRGYPHIFARGLKDTYVVPTTEASSEDRCISYAMGVNDSINSLKSKGFTIKEDDGDYEVSFDYKNRKIWESYIEENIQNEYWNEYIRLSTVDIYFMIKENDKITKVTNHKMTNDSKLLATCNRLCEGNFKTIKDLIFSNDYYKSELSNSMVTEAVEGETDLDKIMGLLAHMNEFKYGFATMSGKVFTGDILDKNDTFQTYYRTMSPNMVEKYQVAVCWDAVAYQANWFDVNVPDISYKCYYCEYEPKIGNSHTWMVFNYQGKKYVFEWSWGSKRGVKVISPANKNTMDIYVEDIPKSDHSPTELKSGKYVVMEYDPHKDPYGCTTSEFMNNKWYKGHIIKTNCKSKQEMKLVFQLDGILEESSKDNIATIDFPNNESIEYAKNDSELSRYADTLIKDCVGEILVDKETEKMIGYAFVYGKKHKDHGFIFNVYLKPSYRGRGLGKQLISDAIHKYDGVDLTVKKNNDHAVDLYKKNGFVVIGDGNSKSEYYMKLKSKLTKDDVVEEACKDPRTARELAQKVKDLAKTYDANFFFVTDGASTTNNSGNPAVQTAREAVAKWEREHGFDDVENWGKNPDDFSQYHLARYTKSDVEKIIKKIHDKTVKDKKEPTGNQNCLLCTWCLEANLRGIDILPRAVYSPSDKIFSFDAISIFRNPKKEKFNSIANFKSMALDAGDNSRFYVHVNWKGSSGGHEFLVLNLSDKVYVADAQVGALHDIDTKGGKKYFTDINFSNSYAARVDLLVLDKSYLQYNDKKYQLEWDDERDSKLVGESSFTESAIFDHDNLEINMDKWKPGNPLWITGSSGDGKSTYSNKLAKEHNAYLVHLDLFLVRIARTREKYEKVLKDTSGTVIGNGSEMVLDYINQHPEIPWGDTMPGGWSPAGRDPKLWNDLFNWILKSAKTDPKYKDKLIIVEGCSITLMPVEQAIKLPVIIMGTSRLTGAIRRLKRDRNEHTDYSIFKLLFREYKRETGKSLQALNKDKDSFEKNLKKSLKSTPYIGDVVTESANNKIGTLHRYTYNGTGIYEALKRAVDMDTWKSLLQSGDINWLPKPPKYASGYASWFSDEGNKEFKKRTLPIMQKYLDKDKIKYTTVANPPSSVIYKDKYQIVVDPDDIFEESVVTESVVFNKKDIYRNLGKFKTGESNILLITGYSGSGKSTLAEGLSKQYKCDYIELDVLDFYIHGYITLDKVKEFEPALFDYIESKGDKFIKNYPGDVYADYIPFVIDWCERHLDRKFIVEGLQLYEIFDKDNPQEFFKKCPIIIKGTSGVVSSARGAKRNDGNSLKNFVYLLKWVLKDTKQLNNLTKFYSESVTETYGKVWMRMNGIYDID